jgi:hypothetical protein
VSSLQTLVVIDAESTGVRNLRSACRERLEAVLDTALPHFHGFYYDYVFLIGREIGSTTSLTTVARRPEKRLKEHVGT